jgi:nitrile hydratase
VDGIHDLGGRQGFGPIEKDEASFHHDWERRVFALVALRPDGNADAFRHAIERLDPVTYLTAGYWGRWLAALELLVRENDPKLRARSPWARRDVDRSPRFAAGAPVRVRDLHRSGHTRMPGYVRGRTGVVARVHPAFVLPDTHAHGEGEHPEHVYAVRFEGPALFGPDAEPGFAVHVDLFESYLEAHR